MDKLPIISQLIGPLTDLLKLLTGALHSYGLAIILFTILVRGALSPLNLRQLRSARKTAALAPRLRELQQRYKNDRTQLGQAQMALYREEGVNPAAGCLPLLIQMPVLYSLFFVFRSLAATPDLGATAIYHKTFLWFTLDKPDSLFGPFFLGAHAYWGPLPILAALTQWIQTRMMLQPTSDPQQRTTMRIMQFIPLMVLFFGVNYPAGLALYWVTSTLFSIALQYFVTGWGQLFTPPWTIPYAEGGPQPPVTPAPRTSPSQSARRDPKSVRAATMVRQRGEGTRSSGSSPTRRSSAPLADSDNGVVADESATDEARLGKMQRAAMRSPHSRPRSSKGAKR